MFSYLILPKIRVRDILCKEHAKDFFLDGVFIIERFPDETKAIQQICITLNNQY